MAAMASHQSQMKAEMMNREQNFTQVSSPPAPSHIQGLGFRP